LISAAAVAKITGQFNCSRCDERPDIDIIDAIGADRIAFGGSRGPKVALVSIAHD
jgi:hypothetical protein